MLGYQPKLFINLVKSSISAYCRQNVVYQSTIYALSSGYGKCGVAVIRISGPKASEVIFNIAEMKQLPKPRFAKLCRLKDPITKDTLDQGLVLWFPGPKSFSGEDICELHIHGGQAVITSILTALSKLASFEPAEPGEFTRRAFHAGKLDLIEVEGLGDLLSAETEAQRKQAYLQMEGALSSLYSSWRKTLLKCVAHLEAFIDFSEDENIEDNIMTLANSTLVGLEKEIQDHIHQSRCGERLREGVRTVIIGEPNVGKSSLLNILCNRPAAIVTPIAGTTRDIVELHMNIGGYPVLLADTAGLHCKTEDEIEIEGMIRAKTFVKSADMVLLVVDTADCLHKISCNTISFENYIQNYVLSLGIEEFSNVPLDNVLMRKSHSLKKENHKNYHLKNCIFVLNKSDLINNQGLVNKIVLNYHNVVHVSCKTKDGMNNLQSKITEHLVELCGNPTRERPNFTQARHRYHLSKCLTYIHDYFSIYNNNGDLVLAAQKLRNSLRSIGKITGHVHAEEVLDVIFKDFCIGK